MNALVNYIHKGWKGKIYRLITDDLISPLRVMMLEKIVDFPGGQTTQVGDQKLLGINVGEVNISSTSSYDEVNK